jgi:hypothetical protein
LEAGRGLLYSVHNIVEGVEKGSFDPVPHLKIWMCSFVE